MPHPKFQKGEVAWVDPKGNGKSFLAVLGDAYPNASGPGFCYDYRATRADPWRRKTGTIHEVQIVSQYCTHMMPWDDCPVCCH